MKFSDDQAIRIECESCDDIYIGPELPTGGWTNVRESDDRFYNFRATCPRCSIPVADPDPVERAVRDSAPVLVGDAQHVPLWSPMGVSVAPDDRRCGDCTFLGPLGRDCLPDHGLCHHPTVLRCVNVRGMIYHIRHRPDEGRGCEGFQKR